MRLVMTVQYVTKRKKSKYYYFKFTIPADCRDGLKKKEILKSLGTTDIREAEEQAERLATIWKARIARMRKANESGTSELLITEFKLEEVTNSFRRKIAPHIKRQIHASLAKSDTEMRRILHLSIENSIDAYQKCIAAGTYTDQELINLINPFAETNEFVLDTCAEFEPRGLIEDDVLTGVARRIIPVILDGLHSVRAAILKELSPSQDTLPRSQITAPAAESGMKLSEVLDEMLQSTFRAEKTDLNIRANVDLMIEWKGDVPIKSLARADLLDFRDNCLRKLPVNISKRKTYAEMSVREVLDTYDGTDFISNRTVNNKMTSVIQLMTYALENRYIEFAPVKKLKIPEEKNEAGKAFTPDELKSMVELLEPSDKHPSRYWIPLLGMYTGARLNELCQLHTDDIYQEDGAWLIDINDNNATTTHKQLKNGPSKRTVPVHPELIKRGFIEFTTALQKAIEQPLPLFSDLSYRENHGYRSRLSNWFNKKFKPEFYTGPPRQKNFHSLRYSFIQQCQNQDDPLDDRAIMELTGHALTQAGITSVHLGYSGKLKPKALYEQISKLDYGF